MQKHGTGTDTHTHIVRQKRSCAALKVTTIAYQENEMIQKCARKRETEKEEKTKNYFRYGDDVVFMCC